MNFKDVKMKKLKSYSETTVSAMLQVSSSSTLEFGDLMVPNAKRFSVEEKMEIQKNFDRKLRIYYLSVILMVLAIFFNWRGQNACRRWECKPPQPHMRTRSRWARHLRTHA